MKLRTLDCKNCAAPLRQEGEKLVCRSCGSVFDIPKDANDIEYERTINAEDYIRLELAKSLLALENSYKAQEQFSKEKRDRDYAARRKRLMKILGLIILITCVSTMFEYLIGGALFISLSSLSYKKQQAENADGTLTWDPGYRVTPSDLKKDKVFWNYIDNDIIVETKAGYNSYGSVIFSSDEIWEVSGKPEVLDRYLITYDDSNALYIIFKVTFKNIDGTTQDMYCCRAAENIKVNKGKIEYDKFIGKDTDSYDFRFHSDTDLDLIYETYINGSPNDYRRYVFEF